MYFNLEEEGFAGLGCCCLQNTMWQEVEAALCSSVDRDDRMGYRKRLG